MQKWQYFIFLLDLAGFFYIGGNKQVKNIFFFFKLGRRIRKPRKKNLTKSLEISDIETRDISLGSENKGRQDEPVSKAMQLIFTFVVGICIKLVFS